MSHSPSYFSRSWDGFGNKIPFIVTDLINRLREIGAASSEGLFRRSGLSRDNDDLIAVLQLGRVTDWSKFANPHVVASVLKLYFHNLSEDDPVVPDSIAGDFFTIPARFKDPEAATAAYKAVLDRLDHARKFSIVALFGYLHEVFQESASKMTPRNLSIVIAPCLFRPPALGAPEELMKAVTQQNAAVQKLLELYGPVFDGILIPDTMIMTDEDLALIAKPALSDADATRLEELRQIRSDSVIPYVPGELLQSPGFVRPTRRYP
jgi:hypothetical protein